MSQSGGKRGKSWVASLLSKFTGVGLATRQPKALSEAIPAGDAATVRALLDEGADVNAPNEQGMTPLFMAARSGDTEIVRLLLEASADVNATFNEQHLVPLSAAVAEGYAEVVRLLLEAGADVNVTTSDGTTLLLVLDQA